MEDEMNTRDPLYPSLRIINQPVGRSAKVFRLGFTCGEPLGAKPPMKKADGSAFGFAAGEPRLLRSRGC